MVKRLRRRRDALSYATGPHDLGQPTWRLHQLSGGPAGSWSIRVSGNWRITFRFADGKAVDIDLVDYH